MGELRSQDKRDKLRLFYKQANAGGGAGGTLIEVLEAALKTADDAVSNGAFVVSTAEAGGSVSFQLLNEYSPVMARRLVGELLDLYDRAVNALGSSSNDEAIYNTMKSSLVAVRRFANDFTGLRYGAGVVE
jgi:hypothetical protein